MDSQHLGDKGLSILVFAAYHQLTSGEVVSEVVLRDGSGHVADPQGVREVEALGLARIENDRAVLSDAGLKVLADVVAALRGVGGRVESGRAMA